MNFIQTCMVKGLIIYDGVIRDRIKWEQSIQRLGLNMPYEGDLPELSEVQSHYFAIKHNNPKSIESQVRNQLKEVLGSWSPLVWEAVLDKGENCEVYRIDTPKVVIISRKLIYSVQSRWLNNKTLHNKGPEAIRNLIKKLESGKI